MTIRTRRILAIALALVWTAYWLWSFITEAGLAAYVARLQVEYFGGFEVTLTLVFGWLIGLALAFSIAPKTETGDVDYDLPEREVDPNANARRAAKWVMIAGLVGGAAGAGGLYQYGKGHADGTQPPIEIDVASFDADTLPLGQLVTLLGDRPDFGAIITETVDGKETDIYYIPVTPKGSDPSAAPIQFLQVLRSDPSTQPSETMFQSSGYLRDESIELLARDVLRDQGLIVAEDTYLVEVKALSPQYEMFKFAGIAGVMGLVFAALGGVMLLLGRRKA